MTFPRKKSLLILIDMKKEIMSFLPTECPWRDTLYWYESVDSTNTLAKELAKKGAPNGTVLIAKHQTQGRGRLGRSFYSPAANGLYLSVILRPGCQSSQLMHLTCAVAVAVCDAIQTVTDFRPGIKWINDLVANKRKLGGILTELSIDPGTQLVDFAIVGIGINCLQKSEDFPKELQDIAISLQSATNVRPDLSQLSAAIVASLWNMSKTLLSNKAQIIGRYKEDCITLGKEVALLQGKQRRCATALDVDNDGQLLVRFPDGKTEAVNSGEVSCRDLYSI